MSFSPGTVRDAIIQYLGDLGTDASTADIQTAVSRRVGDVPASSVRSYLSLNAPEVFYRTARGRYGLASNLDLPLEDVRRTDRTEFVGRAQLINADSFDWMARCDARSIHAIVTDPPYGLVEYTEKETAKLRSGKGGVWRIPPTYDGYTRAALPRFTVLSEADKQELFSYFKRFGILCGRVTVPGANIIVASNPLLVHIVASAMSQSGLELRGYISRQVMTLRGGDRPKNAHEEFDDVSVMPRSQWEPWVIFRTPLEGRVQDNLRKWKTGGFRRVSSQQPFGDVILSSPTPANEKRIAPHPSLKPQAFMRRVVRAVLPLGEGVVLDPFMGAGSTLAAANFVNYQSIGIERDSTYFSLAVTAVPKLSKVLEKKTC